MVERDITTKMLYMASKFPVLTLTGTRQCGKSTLLRNKFEGYKYVSLEDVDIREFAVNDPRGFLNNFGDHLIIDEAQYAPKLFSYIQTAVDSKNESGMYILSGSHNFLLLESISQSLAGRTAVM
ncbi:MAG: AAA family ATPase, partial [Bacteroidales bacterium]|nr:AAA family ATPase [Bacteroidales bacterium]